jgi:hypothetical protein
MTQQLLNKFRSLELTLENGDSFIKKNEFELDEDCNSVSNHIIIEKVHDTIKSLQIKPSKHKNATKDYKDGIFLANGSNTGKINKNNDDNNKYNNIIYQKGRGFKKFNHFKINGNEKESSTNNGGIKNNENGKILSYENPMNYNEICLRMRTKSPLNSKIIVRKKLDNNFRIKNIYKINNGEVEKKEEIKNKQNIEKEKEKEKENKHEKEEEEDSSSEEEEEEDDDESEEDEDEDEEFDDTCSESESDSDDYYKKYNYNNKVKTLNGDNKCQYINNDSKNNEKNNLVQLNKKI